MRFLFLTLLVGVTLAPLGDGRIDQPEGKAAAKELPAKHVRVTPRELLDVRGALIQELSFETSEPAQISLMLMRGDGSGGGGQVILTKRGAGQRYATGRAVFLLDRFSASEDPGFVKKSFLKFAVERLDDDGTARSGDSGQPEEAPDAKYVNDIVKQTLKPGVYPYTGAHPRDDEMLEVLRIGNHRVVLWVSEPEPLPK